MPLKLKGKVQPGKPDRRYYMIRVQVDGRREVLSSGTRDRNQAIKKEQLTIDTLKAQPHISKADLRAAVVGPDQASTRRSVRLTPNVLTLEVAERLCMQDRDLWGGLKTRKTYASNMVQVKNYFGTETPLNDLTEESIKKFTKHQLDQGRAPAGVTKTLAILHRLLRLSQKMPGGVTKVPEIALLKGRRRMFIMTHEQEVVFLKGVEDAATRTGRGPNPDGMHLANFFRVLIETGMRKGEALKLKWGDIVSEGGMTVIRLWRREELKTDYSVRTIPATARCVAALDACRHLPDGPFKNLTKGKIDRAWAHGRKAAGITERDCVPHCLRHTCATRLLQSTGDIKLAQVWLGHSDVATTARVYAHVTDHHLRKAATALELSRGTQYPTGNG